MKPQSIALIFLLTLALICFPSTQASSQTSTVIIPVVTVSPPTFPIGQTSSVFLSITNGNPYSNKNIQSVMFLSLLSVPDQDRASRFKAASL